MKLFALSILFLSSISFAQVNVTMSGAGNVMSVNGQTYTCDGDMTMEDGKVYCNGKLISGNGSGSQKPCTLQCGCYKEIKHPNGGGIIGDRAKVDAAVYVSAVSKVCGRAKVKGKSKLLNKTHLSGNVTVSDSELNNSNVSGNVSITLSKIGASNISGNATIVNSTLSSTNASGNIEATSTILNSSVLTGNCSVTGGVHSNLNCSGNQSY